MPVETDFAIDKLDPLIQSMIALQKRQSLFPTKAAANRSAATRATAVVIGVSGGADSVCLLHLLWTLSRLHPTLSRLHPTLPRLHPWQIELHVAHLDHGLRAESSQDAAFVQEMAESLDLPCHIETLAPNALTSSAVVSKTAASKTVASKTVDQKGGVEDAARQARYDFFGRVASKITHPDQQPLVAVAHNADDQAETVLMNFIRGSGLDGLGGMKWKADLPVTVERSTQVVRPLLDTPRAEILAYLARHNLRWREDGSNLDKKFLRNRIRHEIMPLLKAINPDLLQTLGRGADIMAAEAARINALDAQTLAEIELYETAELTGNKAADKAERILLNLEKLRSLDTAARRNVLRQALYRICHNTRDVNFGVVESLAQAIHPLDPTDEAEIATTAASGPHPLIGGICWTILPAKQHEPATLSIHGSNLPPYRVDHPLLDAAVDVTWQHNSQRAIDQQAIQPDGVLNAPNGWILRSTTIDIEALPAAWREQDPWSVYLDATCIVAPVLCTPLSNERDQLRFAPLGMNGQHKSLGNFFTDRKIPPALRANWPLVVEAENERILWVCGLQPAEDARITKSTQQVLHLRWEKEAMKKEAMQEQATQPKRNHPRVNVKPLTHWIIYKSYSVRFSSRTPQLVTGVLTTPDGPVNFSYEPQEMLVHIQSNSNESEQNERIQINEHGWEV